MQGYSDFFKGKKITLMGLGLLGRGVGDAGFLAPLAKELIVTDKKTEEQLKESVERLKKYPNVSFHLGGHDKKDFTNADMVIKAAGVPLDSPEIAAARETGVPVYMSTALFAKFAAEAGATIVGVTGTRGKTTVSRMIHHALVRSNRRSFLGGNVRGLSTLSLLPGIEKGNIYILELDSWQLQGFGDLHMSPHIAVFTNFMPDHMNYYGGDMEKYFADKANIFNFQKAGDQLIVGEEVVEKVRGSHSPLLPCTPEPLPQWHLRIIGAHNIRNAMLAREALHVLGLNDDEIRSGLESFEGVEGRLQLAAEKNGVKIYNDNNATTPPATIEALKAVDDGRHAILLIAGGSDKNLDLSHLVSEIKVHAKKVYLLKGTGSNRLAKDVPSAETCDSLDIAFRKALEESQSGDTILFSPAFASFGMFKNEYDRNDQFLALVRKLS